MHGYHVPLSHDLIILLYTLKMVIRIAVVTDMTGHSYMIMSTFSARSHVATLV